MATTMIIRAKEDRFEFAELDLEEDAMSKRAKEDEVEGMSPWEMLGAFNTNSTDLRSIETRAKATQGLAKMGLLLGVSSGIPGVPLEEVLERMNIGMDTKLRRSNRKSAGKTKTFDEASSGSSGSLVF